MKESKPTATSSSENNNNNNNQANGDDDSESKTQALLLMGQACLNSAPLTREFRIRNEGSKAGQIKWKVRASYPGVDTRWVNLL